MTYTWLLFDADNTLFDYPSAEAAALQGAFDQHGLSCTDTVQECYRAINSALWRDLELGKVSSTALRVLRFERLCQELDLGIDYTVLSSCYLDHLALRGDLMPGALETVQALHQQYRLAILTNGISAMQRSRLAHSPLQPYFEELIISEEVGAHKPDPAIFRAALERMGQPQKQVVLMIGDSLSADIIGANQFGLDTCWFNPTRLPLPAGVSVRYEITRLSQLPEILLNGMA